MAGFGGSVKLTGETEYQKALKRITDNLTVLSSEMKVVSSSFGRNEDSITSLSQKNEILNKKLGEQNKALSEAKKMLDEAKTSTDSNEQTVQKWQNAVNKAQAEVNKTTRELKENEATMKDLKDANVETTSELKKLDNSLEDVANTSKKSNEGFTVLKGTIANLASKAISSAISGLKDLGSAVVDVGKQALESYADYEQLVGGVETLFKDSSKEVQNYANNAYKTAGLSANEYMETVTSFSASLLQGLNGDTAKTAQIADLAITDMADNANKMGTSMESIQNAYQGFAKQNYTMLDNLKLGYGGTKEEMVRLINDSKILNKKIEDLDDISFDQIIKAIHKVQENMGITGTTAKEASETISGSTASMKSAWQNLLTGIADETQDFEKLVDNFVDSVITSGDNIVPRVKKIVEGIKKLVNSIITDVFPKLKREIPELRPLIETFEWFIDNKSKVVNAVKLMIGAFAVSKVANFTKSLSDIAKSFLTMIANAKASALALNTNTTAQVANTTAQVAGTTATKGLTVATNLLNTAWKANPIGLVVTAITSLVAIMSLIKNKTDETTEAEKLQREELERQTEEINNNKEAWEGLVEEQQNAIDAGMTEMSYYESLASELEGIVDANGKVKKGYEERASFITSTLAEALGIEIQTVDGIVQKYDELKSSIDEVIEKKRAQIWLDSQETLYKEAIDGQTDALKLLGDAQDTLNTRRAEAQKAQENYDTFWEEYKEKAKTATEEELRWDAQKLASKYKTYEETQTLLNQAQTNYDNQLAIVEGYAYNIGVYENNMALAHAGKYDEMTTVNWNYVQEYQNAEDAKKAMLEDSIKNQELWLQTLKGMRDESNKDIIDGQIKTAETQLEELKKDLKQYESTTAEGLDKVELAWSDSLDDQLSEITGSNIEFKDAGNGNVQMYVDGVANGEPKSKQEMASLVKSTILEISKQETGAYTAGKDLINGVNNGVGNQSAQSSVFGTIRNFGANLLANLKSSLQEHSPSKATKEMGQYLLEGLGLGIDKEEKSVLKQVSSLGKNIISSFNNSLESDSLRNNLSSQIQSAIPTNVNAKATLNGMTAKGSGSINSHDNMVNAFKEALKTVKVVMNDREMGTFVEDTMTKVVYS